MALDSGVRPVVVNWMKGVALAGTLSFAAFGLGQILGSGGIGIDPFPSEDDARRSGPGHYWQGGGGSVNPFSHSKQTSIGLIGWRTLGGTSMGLSLHHNSMALRTSPVGSKWRHTYETELLGWAVNGVPRAGVIWGDHRIQLFERIGNTWRALDGYRDTLEQIGQNYRLTLHGQTEITFEPTPEPIPTHAKRHRMFAIVDRTTAVSLTYDGAGRLARVSEPSGRALQFSYSGNRLAQVAFFVGGSPQRTWQLVQDANGQLLRVFLPTVTTDMGPQTYQWEFAYDARSNLRRIIDCEGFAYLYEYVGNRLVSEQWPTNGVNQKVLFAVSGALRTVTDPVGNQTVYEYDSLSRLIRARDGGGFNTMFEHGDPDHPYVFSRVLAPSGTQYRYDYDARGNLVKYTDPAGPQWDMSYDGNNNLLERLEPLVTDAFGNTESSRHRTIYAYDGLDRCISRRQFTDAVNFLETQYQYDAASNLVAMTNPLGNTWMYTYDANGNMRTATTPMNRRITWIYDTAQLTAGFTTPNAWLDAAGLRTELINDEWGRRRGSDFSGQPDHQYRYDGMNRLIRMDDGTGMTTWTYDACGRMLQANKGAWFCQNTYDANGRLVRLVEDSGTGIRALSYTYNSRNLLATMDDLGAISTFLYNNDGQLIMRQLGNGAASIYGYGNGRLASVLQRNSANAPIITLDYAYQANGMLAQNTENGLFQRFKYDHLNRIVREERNAGPAYNHLWSYDAAGNRTQQSKSGVVTVSFYDMDNLLVQAVPQAMAPETYQYDQNGRLIRRERNNNSEIFRFEYDATGNLVDLDQWNGNAFENYRNFQYDALGSRVGRDIHSAGMFVGHNTYWMSGGRLLREDRVIQGQPSTNVMTWAGGLIRQNDLNGRETWSGTDGLGNMRTSTDGGGAFSGLSTVYNAFGETMQTSGPSTVYQFGADSGMRNEGDANMLWFCDWVDYYLDLRSSGSSGNVGSDHAWGSFYDPKIGLSLPTGPNIFGPSSSFFDIFFEVDFPSFWGDDDILCGPPVPPDEEKEAFERVMGAQKKLPPIEPPSPPCPPDPDGNLGQELLPITPKGIAVFLVKEVALSWWESVWGDVKAICRDPKSK